MRSQSWNIFRGRLALGFKFTAIFSLFLVSVLIVACGGNPSSTAGLGSPPPTLTINLNQIFASPTPTLPPYSCGAWVTQTSPAYHPNAVVAVYAKYVQNVNGNPQGMNQAHAQATVLWPAGTSTSFSVTTTQDGLAVFIVPLQASAVGHETLVEVSFTSQDGKHTCNVTGTQDAFFVAVIASPTASPTGQPGGTTTPGAGPSPTGSPDNQASPTPTFGFPQRTPSK